MNEDKISTIKAAQKGDKLALIKLIKQEQNNIYSTLFYLKKDEIDLLDIMQDILIKISRKIRQLKNPDNFKTWLNQIVLNSYYDYLRKIKNRPKNINLEKFSDDSQLELPDYSSNPQDRILYSELDFIIKNAIQNLPNHYKIPITLREIQGLSYDEISDITKTTVGTVKSRIARARALIKNDINRYTKG